jgi:hypothetical protein
MLEAKNINVHIVENTWIISGFVAELWRRTTSAVVTIPISGERKIISIVRWTKNELRPQLHITRKNGCRMGILNV